MNFPTKLTNATFRVIHPGYPGKLERSEPFMVSFMPCALNCLQGVAHYKCGQKRPRRQIHMTATPAVRLWVSELEEAPE